MSNEDKRRRRDGSTAQLSVAELLARREAETQPIPVYRDDEEDTIRFRAVTAPAALTTTPISRQSLSGRELHVAELLRREGRPADEERSGMKISKLVAIASGGVVLCGTVAFGASQWLGSPDERPLADVRFDDRPAARNSNGTSGIGGLALPGTTTPETSTQQQTKDQTQEQTPQQQATQQNQPRSAPVQDTQAPDTQTPSTQTQAPTTTTPPATTTQPTPEKGTPTKDTTTTPTTSSTAAISTTPVADSSTPPSSSTPSSSQPSTDLGVGVKLGSFDFFAEL
ncbi:MAG: hypothetical protein ABIQ18_35345 [Umezawaea sp.]